MFKFILGIIFGIIITSLLSEYRIVKVNNNTSTNDIKAVDVKFIPDSWKNTIENYWKEKHNEH